MILPILLTAFCLSISSCVIDDRHPEMSYDGENSDIHGWDNVDGDDVIDWDNVDVQTWDETDEISSWVYSQILFENITDEFASVNTVVLDYKSNGKYFDASEERTILKDYYGKLKIVVSTKDNEAKLTVYYRPAEFTEEQRGWLEELGIKAYNRK